MKKFKKTIDISIIWVYNTYRITKGTQKKIKGGDKMKRKTKEKIKDTLKGLLLISVVTLGWVIASLLASLVK